LGLWHSSKEGKTLIEKHAINAFLYNPYGEEPVRDMYEVVKRNAFAEKAYNDDDHQVEEYFVRKARMVNDSDVSFLMSGKLKSSELLTYEEATQKAYDLNQKMLKELQSKINNQEINLKNVVH